MVHAVDCRRGPAGSRPRGARSTVKAKNGVRDWDEFQRDMGWGAVRDEAVMFAPSIRLGRMG